MKQFLILTSLATILLTAFTQQAHAQRRYKHFKRVKTEPGTVVLPEKTESSREMPSVQEMMAEPVHNTRQEQPGLSRRPVEIHQAPQQQKSGSQLRTQSRENTFAPFQQIISQRAIPKIISKQLQSPDHTQLSNWLKIMIILLAVGVAVLITGIILAYGVGGPIGPVFYLIGALLILAGLIVMILGLVGVM